MKIVSIVHSKGGVGKSMAARMVGAGLTCLGFKVVILDADKQASTWKWYQRAAKKGLYDYVPHVDTAPSAAFREHARRNFSHVDVVIIDTIGTKADTEALSILYAAIRDADLVITPLDPSSPDDVADLHDIEAAFIEHKKKNKESDFRYLLSKQNPRPPKKQAAKIIEFVTTKASQGFKTLETPLCERFQYKDAVDEGTSTLGNPKRDPARQELEELTLEVAALLGLPVEIEEGEEA
jgi:chromosome partitioning protein